MGGGSQGSLRIYSRNRMRKRLGGLGRMTKRTFVRDVCKERKHVAMPDVDRFFEKQNIIDSAKNREVGGPHD